MSQADLIQITNSTKKHITIGLELFSDSDFSDVTLVCGDNQHLPAHRAVLCASSSFLRQLLYDSQQQRTFLYLAPVSYEDMRSLLEVIYLGSCTLPRHRLDAVMALAAGLGVTLGEGVPKEEAPLLSPSHLPVRSVLEQTSAHIPPLKISSSYMEEVMQQEQEEQKKVLKKEQEEVMKEDQEKVRDEVLKKELVDWQRKKQGVNGIQDQFVAPGARARFYCIKPGCLYSSKNSFNVKRHQSKQNKNRRCPMLENKDKDCNFCRKTFCQKALYRHLARYECPDQFNCAVCGLKFRKEVLVSTHMKEEHRII